MAFTPSKPAYNGATNTFEGDEPVTDPNATQAVQVPPEADASQDSALDDNYEADTPLEQLDANEA